ncbi:Hypothetical predicted protein [Paramuricea clavata]|uniref:Uncharacterized protein n=1 Tax=Paramuricea clavata TaxID=317549 RepID=A0A6S7K9T5_PARCT|nr:Hypothetical predicted protein [Paramuricea clavata]
MSSIRTLLQRVMQNDMIIHQMDVKTAYLNAPIDCELYMEQPEGFEEHGENGEKLVCKLNKSLYGLKQSGRNWNNLLHENLQKEGFTQSQADPCVYVRIIDSKRCVIVIVWVDDIIIAASHFELLTTVKESLGERFKMKDLGIEKVSDEESPSLEDPGPLISWKSRKQPIVALSTCEAEYIALANAVQEAKFLRQLCIDMKVLSISDDNVLTQVDNQGAINLARNPVHHQRSKHIDTKYHFIRSEIQVGIISLKYVPTEDNIADVFTKPASKAS